VAVALALIGCGVPSDRDARTLGTPPFGLLTTSTTTSATTVPQDEDGFPLTLYWVTADDQIVPGEPIGLPERPNFQQVIDLLAQGPPLDSASGGSSTPTSPTSGLSADTPLRTYITEGLNPESEDATRQAVGPLVVQVKDDGTLDVLVDDRFRDESQATPTRFRLAIAQVVCTVTQFENVDEVRFFDSRGQLTLVNLDQNPIETGNRGNIGRCDPASSTTTERTTTTITRSTTTSTVTTSPAAAASSAAGRSTTSAS
jgi:Sporulation and spore germination